MRSQQLKCQSKGQIEVWGSVLHTMQSVASVTVAPGNRNGFLDGIATEKVTGVKKKFEDGAAATIPVLGHFGRGFYSSGVEMAGPLVPGSAEFGVAPQFKFRARRSSST